jgi:translation elongation factor EF-4
MTRKGRTAKKWTKSRKNILANVKGEVLSRRRRNAMEQSETRRQFKCIGVNNKSSFFASSWLLMEKDYYKITEDGL